MREINYRNKRNKKGIFIGILVGIIALAAFIIFGLYRVQEVVVIGNSRYTAKEIQQAVMKDGLCKNTFYLIWKYSDPSKAEEELPFLSAVEIEMLAPYRVQIRVHEKTEVGYIQKAGSYVYFGMDGNVVENSKKKHKEVPLISGVTLDKVELYEPLPIKDEDVRNTVVALAGSLSKSELVPTEIRLGDSGDITIFFEKIKVNFGVDQKLEEKAAALKSIYPKLEGKEGTLHMENYSNQTGTVMFKEGEDEKEIMVANGADPKEEPEGESESQSESETGYAGRTYQESDGTFSTDAQGNKIYTDANGNTTTQTGQYNYTDENGGIITDGYGYIDPYTGAYIN